MHFLKVHAKSDGGIIYINPQFIDTFWPDAENGVHVTTVGNPDAISLKESVEEFDQMLVRYNRLENWPAQSIRKNI